MNKFDKLFKLFEARYEDIAPNMTADDFEDFDFSKFDKGEDFIPKKVDGDDLSEYSYKLTELAILEALDTQLKPLMIYGESGIGKSKIINNIASKIIAPDRGLIPVEWKNTSNEVKKQAVTDPEWLKSHYMIIDVRAAELEPVDLRGIELPTSRAPYLDPKTPLWIYYASQPESNGLLFFDEMNQAMRQVFNALFGVILDRQAGDLKFADGWGIIAASNLGTKHGTTEPLPIALTQRFDTIYLVADPKQWGEWAMSLGENGLPRLEPDVISYAMSDPDRTFMVEAQAESSQSVPNPRNLETFSKRYRLIKYYYSKPELMKQKRWLTGDIFADIRRDGIKTCGDSWTNGFIQFIKVYSKLDWDDLAKNAKQYSSEQMEQLYAYIYFISRKVVQLVGYEKPLNQKILNLAAKAKAGQPVNESEWDEGKKFIQQFANIASYLIFQAKDVGGNGVQNKMNQDPNLAKKIEQQLDGEGEHLATLISMIRSTDPARKAIGGEKHHEQEALIIIAILCAKYQNLDEDIKTLLIALKQIQSFGQS